MRLTELRQQKAVKVTEVRKLNDENKVEDAEKVLVEVRSLDKQIKIAEELEADEMRDLQRQKELKSPEERENKAAVSEMRSIVKHVMSKEMTAEERATVKSSDNAAILPSEFVNQLQEIKKGYGSLKELCNVISVTKNSGTIPVIDYDQNTLADVAEGADIVDGTLVTTALAYTVAKVGLIQTLSSELVEDAEIEIESLAKTNFTEIAVAKENAKILKVIADNATTVVATDYEELETTMDTAIPGYKAGLITLTNPTGYSYLKNLKDSTGASLKLVTNINGVDYFNDKPLVTVDASLLTLTEGKTKIFFSLNMKEAVKYIERKGVTVARSTEAGFNDDTIKLRILERFIPVKGSTRSIKKIELA